MFLVDPGALLNFDFWKSAIFFISLVLTVLWMLLLVWGWRKDVADLKKANENEELKESSKKPGAEPEHDEKLPVHLDAKDLFINEPKAELQNP